MFLFYIWNFCILSDKILSLRIMETIFWIYVIAQRAYYVMTQTNKAAIVKSGGG